MQRLERGQSALISNEKCIPPLRGSPYNQDTPDWWGEWRAMLTLPIMEMKWDQISSTCG